MNNEKPILITGALVNGSIQDLLIEGNQIARIAPSIPVADHYDVLEGCRRVVVPGMANTHTHAAMTLFRGYGDDLPLMSIGVYGSPALRWYAPVQRRS